MFFLRAEAVARRTPCLKTGKNIQGCETSKYLMISHWHELIADNIFINSLDRHISINGLVQDGSNSSADALELPPSCAKPLL